MKIAIVGNGKVGLACAQKLMEEDHDIIMIDNDEHRLQEVIDTLDVMCYCGNGASYKTLKEAGIDGYDLMVAATSQDEVNLLSCLLAKKLKIKNAIARIRNPEYSDYIQSFQKELGISMSVNPEKATAREIARYLRFPGAIKIESFARGRVELVEIKIKGDSPLKGLSLIQIRNKYNAKVLVCAVQRGEQVFIPSGDFILQEGDRINFTATVEDINTFFNELGIIQKKTRSVMIVGGSRIAYYLAKQLLSLKINVKIVDKKEERCEYLKAELPKAEIICADGSDYQVLVEEGLLHMDGFVSLTGLDETNIVISMYAQSCNVEKIITKVNRISYADILPRTGLETVVSPKEITANNIVRFVRAMQNSYGSSNVEALHKVVQDKVEALEFIVHASDSYLNTPLKQLKLKDNILVASIVRNGKRLLPDGNQTIQLRDRVLVITASDKKLDDLADIFEKEL